MAEFDRPYYSPLDRGYYGDVPRANRRTEAEGIIFPIHMIGQTVPEFDASGRNRNIVEGIDASFRGGAGNIQLVMQGIGQQAAMGQASGPKGYGEDVRQAIREVQKAAGGRITGVELPTQLNNLSGFAEGRFSEEHRKMTLDEVRDSIKFIGDIAGGGGVDVVSFEFPRNFSDGSWWKGEGKDPFTQRTEEHILLVNQKTGQLTEPFRKGDKQYLHLDKNNPDPEHPTDSPVAWEWKDFENWAVKEREKGHNITPEKLWLEHTFEIQKKRLEGDKAILLERRYSANRNLEQVNTQMETASSAEKQKLQGTYEELKAMRDGAVSSLQAIEEQQHELEDRKSQFKPIDEYALGKSTESYAQAGLWAWQESQKNQFVQRGKGSIYVGPELGWPQYYGSHPQEWVDLILESRRKLTEQLVEKEHMNTKEAEKIARDHIKGELDTGHLGMWLQNFKTDLPWDKRVTEFKKWYKDQMEFLAEQNKKYDIIGGVQAVDSATGAHGHLPPGQGVLGKDIFEYMKILKEKGGYKGEITSEGHEEEKFGQGRIMTKAWEAFGSPIGTGYWYGRAMPQMRDVRVSYAQMAYGTTGIFQGYVPSNDFTLWSEVPFE